MNAEITIVKNLMSKYNLSKKDLFSFCICAVNFLEYYEEECMGDVMWSCPDRYYGADSDNTRAVAGALNGEKKEENWTDEEQFAQYMLNIQRIVVDDIEGESFDHFLSEYERFSNVYKREIFVPIMLGCPVEDYDDSKFYDEEYIESIVNKDNMTLLIADEEQRAADLKEYEERAAAELAKKVEQKKNDKDFSILLASAIDISRLTGVFENHNKTYYPDREYNVVSLKPNLMIIQTGGKTIEEVKETVLSLTKSRIAIVGHETSEMLIPIEKVKNLSGSSKELKEYKVTHVVTYI